MNKLQTIQEHRTKVQVNETPDLIQKRMAFLDKLNTWSNNLEVYEMYPFDCSGGSIKTKPENPQYYQEIKFCNTRTQIPIEATAETDKLPYDKSVEFISNICCELVKNNYHFAVFYAKGQKCPHIKIYDLNQLEDMTPYQRLKARARFWRWLIPFRFHLLDQSLFDDSHLVPIEFSIHWKYGTPFNLIFEYVPDKIPTRKIEEPKIKKVYVRTKKTAVKHICLIHNIQMVECYGGWKCAYCILDKTLEGKNAIST